MDNKNQIRLRLPSPEPAPSDANSSIQVNGASSMRAQSTASQSRRATPEAPLSSRHPRRLLRPAQTVRSPLRVDRETSMDDDLRGVDSRAELPHGVKRSRPDSTDNENSDGEPAPKRDKMLQDLDDLAADSHDGDITPNAPTAPWNSKESRDERRAKSSTSPPRLDLALRSREEGASRPERPVTQSPNPEESKIEEARGSRN